MDTHHGCVESTVEETRDCLTTCYSGARSHGILGSRSRECVCVSTRKRRRNKDRGAPPNIIRHSCARDALWTLAPHPVSRDLAFEPLNIPVFSIGTVTILTRVSFLRGVPSHLLFMRVLFFHLSPFLGINSSSRDSRIPSSVIVWYFVSNRIFRTDKSISDRSRHIMSFSVK